MLRIRSNDREPIIMNLRALETLVAVAHHGSMAAAARQLNLTHGAVAQQVRALEESLGVPLVARAGRTVPRTERAVQVLDPMQQVLAEVDRIRYLARTSEMVGELRLGAGNTVLNSMLPVILEQLVKDHPMIAVDIRPGLSPASYPAIEHGEPDAAIALQAPYPVPKSLGWELLREEPYVLAAASRHAGDDPHQLLATQPFIRYKRSEWGGRQVENYLRAAGIRPNERFEVNAIESIAVMVSRGLGVAILPLSTNDVMMRLGLAQIPLPAYCEPRRFGLIWSRASPRISLVQALLRTARAEYAKREPVNAAWGAAADA